MTSYPLATPLRKYCNSVGSLGSRTWNKKQLWFWTPWVDFRLLRDSILMNLAGLSAFNTLGTYETIATYRCENKIIWHHISCHPSAKSIRYCKNSLILTTLDCSNTPQSGHYITFDCPLHQQQRTRWLQGGSNWEEIDRSTWVRVDANKYADGVAIFFSYIFDYLT